MNSLRFSLESWGAWAPDLTTSQAWLDWAHDGVREEAVHAVPAVAKMPAMLRRRAQPLGRMALEVLYAQEQSEDTPIIFASRYGEMGLAIQLLQELAQDGVVSPQSFSMSVHNAIAGLYTIARKQGVVVSALAAGDHTAFAGLFEAVVQLLEGGQRVRLVLCEEPLPCPYQAFETCAPAPFAFMLTLMPGHEFDIKWSKDSERREASPLALLQFMLTDMKSLALSADGWFVQRL